MSDPFFDSASTKSARLASFLSSPSTAALI